MSRPASAPGGFKVDLQAMDWNTVVAAREEGPAGAGGWNIFSPPGSRPTLEPAHQCASAPRARNRGSAGRATRQIEKLRDQFARETDDGKKKALAEAIQVRAFEIGTHAPLGEYVNPSPRARTSPLGDRHGRVY